MHYCPWNCFIYFLQRKKRLSPLLIGDSLLRSPCMEYLLSTSGRFIKDSIQFNRITKLSPNKNLCRVECIAILILVDRWGYGSIFVISSRNLWERGIHLPDIPICRVRIPHCHLIWGSVVLLLLAILVMPFILFLVSASKEVWYLRISVMSIVITFTYQMLNSGFMSFNVNGYPGGISSRYYLCAVPLLAYAIMKLIENNLHKSDDISIRASFRAAHRTMLSTNGIALCAVFALLLVVDGFIYSVLMNLPECSFFYVISH